MPMQFYHKSPKNKIQHYDHYAVSIDYYKTEISYYIHYAAVIQVTKKHLGLRSLSCFVSQLRYHTTVTTLL